MTRFELLKLLNDHGLSVERLRDAGDLDGFADEIVALLAMRQKKINELEERLRKRTKRQAAQSKAVPGKRGRPQLHRQDWDYYLFWLEKQWNGGNFGRKGWLNATQTDMDGTSLTPTKRRHISKMLSDKTPPHIKDARHRTSASTATLIANVEDAERWAEVGPTGADQRIIELRS